MTSTDIGSGDLAGVRIQEVFKGAEAVAEVNAAVTSPRGEYFRLRLLHATELPVDEAFVERLRGEAGINEHHRHIHILMKHRFIREDTLDGASRYVRTSQGERAINAVRQLDRRLGKEASRTIHGAALGANSIRLFLRIYGDSRDADWELRRVRYTPVEIGRLSLFLPRVIEGISALDTLNEAGLLVYGDDDHVHMQPVKARSYYLYLRDLWEMAKVDRTGS